MSDETVTRTPCDECRKIPLLVGGEVYVGTDLDGSWFSELVELRHADPCRSTVSFGPGTYEDGRCEVCGHGHECHEGANVT